jgi:hypothetical protein
MIAMASNGHLQQGLTGKRRNRGGRAHLLTHIPQPIHRTSEMKAILSVGVTSIHILPS